MKNLILILLMTFCCFSSLVKASKCDFNIINKIKDRFWNNGKCVPRDLLRTLDYMSPGTILSTTKDYYPDEDNVTCVYTLLEHSTIKVFTQYDCSSSSANLTDELVVVEKDGFLFEPARGVYKYHLYSDRYGVTVMYKCYLIGKSGEPEGLIKGSVHGYDPQALAEGIKDLAFLGIKVSDKMYDSSCTPSSTSCQTT